jgi:hypothetical protein
MLKVSTNRRFLVHDDGTPFFYLGDTAWELFHRLTRDEAADYLQNRATKGFTVIQAVVLAEFDGIHVPNAQGDTPLLDDDPATPNEAYFQHVDAVVEQAAALGLHIGMLPTWGDKWNLEWGKGPQIFTPDNARVYGAWLGRRYADAPVIWILGGDRPVANDEHRAIIAAMAEGLREGDGGRHLITFHPAGKQASAQYFHDAPWLDFNMVQSGHDRNHPNWEMIERDYARTPPKPCMDAEPGYEDHPSGFRLDNGYLDDYDTRKALYWSLFAGAHGHTYGCHVVWQFWHPARKAVNNVRRPWREAIDLPGAAQVQHARALLLSRPYFSRIPDQTLIVSENGVATKHLQATRADDGSYALVYTPTYNPFEVDLANLAGPTLSAHWFDPRTGLVRRIGDIANSGTHTFTPPEGGPDWVLVLDAADRRFPTPGTVVLPDRDAPSLTSQP